MAAVVEEKLVTIEYERTMQDLWAASRVWRRNTQGRTWEVFYWTMFASAACLVADLLLGSTRGVHSALLEGLVALMLIALLVWNSFRRWKPAAGEFRKYLGQTRVQLSDEGVSVDSRYMRQFLPWETFEGLEQTGTHLVLVLPAASGVAIPKAGLTPEQSSQVYCRLRDWIGVRHCAHCGYNLTGNTSGVCPECGRKT